VCSENIPCSFKVVCYAFLYLGLALEYFLSFEQKAVFTCPKLVGRDAVLASTFIECTLEHCMLLKESSMKNSKIAR